MVETDGAEAVYFDVQSTRKTIEGLAKLVAQIHRPHPLRYHSEGRMEGVWRVRAQGMGTSGDKIQPSDQRDQVPASAVGRLRSAMTRTIDTV